MKIPIVSPREKAPRLSRNGGGQLQKASMKDNLHMTLMLLPGVILLFIFHYLPLPGIIIAFKDFNPNLGIFESEWVGFKNFEFYFTSQDAGRTIRNTMLYGVTFLILGLVTNVGLALLFYNLRSRKALKVYNTIVILPKFLSAVVIAFIVYLILNPSNGLMNRIIMAFGGKKIQWYMQPKYWPVILTIVHIWHHVGMGCVVFYAALMGVDDSLLEAARLDGANKLQETWHVLIPHLVPIMVISTILSLGVLISGDFGLFYQTPKNIGLLYPTTDIINTYTFRALMSGAMEKSAAVGLFQSVVSTFLIVTTNLIVRKVDPDSSLF